jgi:hypothetical protein
MKVFVDDLRPCPPGWELARSITEAIRFLATREVKEISLDHDIRHCKFRKHWSLESFEPVAYYIACMDSWSRPLVRIHTANVMAGQRMAEIIGMEYNNEIYDARNY